MLLRVACVLAMLLAGCGPRPDVTFVRFASGPSGGAWYPLGAKIAQILGDSIPGIATSNMPGGGETNLREVHRGTAQLAFTYSSSAYDAYEGSDRFGEPRSKVRHFATLYPAAFQVAVRRTSDILRFEDLGNRNISPGTAGLTTTLVAEQVLRAHGITFDSVRRNGGTVHHVDFSDSAALLKDGHIDAFLAITAVPQAIFIDLNFQPGIRFLPIDAERSDRLLAANPGFIEMTIPREAYDGLEGDVPTIGVVTSVVVNADLPEDLVYRMAEVFWRSHGALAETAPVWEDVRLEDALRAVAVPVHPGAQRFYDEVGVERRTR